MSETKRKYRNYENTEIAIKDALVSLCEQKNSMDKVTVKELCELANISKTTFYLHYHNIDYIFESVAYGFIMTFSKVIKRIGDAENPNIAFFIENLLINLKESNKLVTIALKYGSANSQYINAIKNQLEAMIHASNIFQRSKIEKSQLVAEAKIISAGITDYVITLLCEDSTLPAKTIANSIHALTTRWSSSL